MRTNLKVFFTALLTGYTCLLYAQNASVKGVVHDAQSKQPVEYASVALLKAGDSSVVTGVLTKADGAFEFGKLNAGNYVLKVAFIGFNTRITRPFQLTDKGRFDAGVILVSPSQKLLSEVRVNGQRANALNKIDKQTYRADQFETAKGGTAIDVLKNLPSVTVNGEGDISIRGSTGFLVLVNGKPVLTDAQTVLSQLPANGLQSIELLTSP